MRPLAWLGIVLVAAAALLLGVAPAGWRIGLWRYGTSFVLLRWVAYGALAGGAASLVALVRWRRLGRRLGGAAVVAVLAAGLVFYMPWHYTLAAGASIHDITTDTDNPPQFVAAVAEREAAHAPAPVYPGAATAAIQKRAYPDLAPLALNLAPDKAFALALATAQAMPRWTIVASDPAAGRIEATARTLWMGFVDDVVIRIVPTGEGARVDMRSLSRVGRGDFAANATRIRQYLAALKAAAG